MVIQYVFQSSYDRPDPAEVRKRYEQELKEQMEIKKKLDDEVSDPADDGW